MNCWERFLPSNVMCHSLFPHRNDACNYLGYIDIIVTGLTIVPPLIMIAKPYVNNI